jgi:hypothetical protein
MNNKLALSLTCSSLVFLAFAATASTQLGDLIKKNVKVPNFLAEKPPITTSLDDAKWGDSEKDSFTPREAKTSLMTLQRTPNGGFVLQPGYYEMQTQSYCLKAGTHGPGAGDGYLFAPPKGPAEDAVMTILRNSVNRPEIPQRDIQTLLWAIIARAKFEDMSQSLKATASSLLTPRQLTNLNRSALDTLNNPLVKKALGDAPGPLKQVLEAEAQLRTMLTTPGGSFEDLERIAVLTGTPGLGEGSKAVPSGRWSAHPDGYFVRYLPSGYSSTRVEIWVPQGSPSVGKEYDPAAHIAVPGNTARQRLIQSGRAQQS